MPTLCFSFFSDEGAVYRESTGYPLLDDLVSENVFVSLVGDYDFSTYVGGYAKDLYQQTGGKRFNLKDDTLLSERLIKYIYELSESEELPEIENKYPMILSTGLEYVELDAPITIDYINAYRSITAANHNSSKFSGYADTDEDGLYDFEEINFGYDLIRRENGRVVLPTYGECIDKYSGLFYVEEGLDRFFESAPDYLPTADAHRVLYNTKVLPIRSDPTRSNADGDSYTDYEEFFTYESNPLEFTYLIEKEPVDFLIDSDNFGAEIYREFYEDDEYSWLTKASVWFGNNVVGNNHSTKKLYSSLLLEYFDSYNKKSFINIENKTKIDCCKKGIKEIYDILSNPKLSFANTLFTDVYINEQKSICQELLGCLSDSRSFLGNQTYLDNLTDQCTTYIDSYSKIQGFSDKLSKFTLGYEIAETCISYTTIYSNYNLIKDNCYVLKLISENANDSKLREATQEILEIFTDNKNTIDSVMYAMEMGFEDSLDIIITDKAHELLMEYGGVVGLIAELSIQALDALLNISEEAKQSIYTYGMASVSNLISDNLSEKIYCLDSNNNYYYDNSNCLEQSIINLAYSRRFAEIKYSENMLAIPLWIRKYIYDYTSTVDTDNGEMDLLAYRNIIYIEEYLSNEI